MRFSCFIIVVAHAAACSADSLGTRFFSAKRTKSRLSRSRGVSSSSASARRPAACATSAGVRCCPSSASLQQLIHDFLSLFQLLQQHGFFGCGRGLEQLPGQED